jgi:DNA-binding transcriptional LysR family regulator
VGAWLTMSGGKRNGALTTEIAESRRSHRMDRTNLFRPVSHVQIRPSSPRPVDLAGTEGLETYPFRIDRFVVVVPRGHALASRRDIAFVDVLDEEFVGLEDGSALAEHLARQSARLGRSLRLRIRLRGLDAVCRMVECGVGIAVVPETAAQRCRRTMTLCSLRLVDPWATRQLIICARRLDALPVHARRLVEHLAGTT